MRDAVRHLQLSSTGADEGPAKLNAPVGLGVGCTGNQLCILSRRKLALTIFRDSEPDACSEFRGGCRHRGSLRALVSSHECLWTIIDNRKAKTSDESKGFSVSTCCDTGVKQLRAVSTTQQYRSKQAVWEGLSITNIPLCKELKLDQSFDSQTSEGVKTYLQPPVQPQARRCMQREP